MAASAVQYLPGDGRASGRRACPNEAADLGT